MKTNNPLELLAHDCVMDGQKLAVEHLIKVYSATKSKTGGNATLTIDEIIIQLEELKERIEKSAGDK